MLFSQRNGYTPVKVDIQKESMDRDLRVAIWNSLTQAYWNHVSLTNSGFLYSSDLYFMKLLWSDYFKQTLNTFNPHWDQFHKGVIHEYFFKCQWHEIYDFVEFFINHYPHSDQNESFITLFNIVSEKELSAYRIVGNEVSEITASEEIDAIETALEATSQLPNIHAHLKTSLGLLSDRSAPDYRNSIKESISAVEAICSMIAENPKITLGQALKVIAEKLGIHPALATSFSNLYGYTSNADGIRHALKDEPNVQFEDAKFMLVSCASFVNYLLAKCARNNITLN